MITNFMTGEREKKREMEAVMQDVRITTKDDFKTGLQMNRVLDMQLETTDI